MGSLSGFELNDLHVTPETMPRVSAAAAANPGDHVSSLKSRRLQLEVESGNA